jgi:catechol 2,3-dioxygenase-like lactoylglutathione lyase family enzyme
MPATPSLDHVTIVTDDFAATRPAYDAVLGALGLTPQVEYSDPEGDEDDTGEVAAIGYAVEGGTAVLWLVAGLQSTTGAHFALRANDRMQVNAAYEAAAGTSARQHQAPRQWEDAQLHYFGAQLVDRHGNVIEVLYRD